VAKNSEYWQERFTQLEDAQHNKGVKYLVDLEDQFRRATSTIETQIATWYQRLADNNGISYAKATQMLNSKELKEFRWTVEEYIKRGEENALTGEWMKELENASARVHISRLEAQKIQLQHQLEVLYGNQSDDIDRLMTNIYTDGYYHTAYEVQKGYNIGYEFSKLDTDRIEKVLSKPWTPDGKNFSERIWGNKTKLVNSLYTNLTQSIIRGDTTDKTIRNITQIMNTSRKNAARLVLTEAAFFASASQKDCFSELDVEQYEIVATLDSHTSTICRDLDGKVFKMSEYLVGVTAPPFHVYCRTTTVPYFDDNYTERVARDYDGNTYYVDGNMSYNNWYKQYVEKPLKNDIIKTDKQFGKKVGKHTKEYGLNPSKTSDREKMKNIIDDILVNYTEIAHGNWRGQEGEVDFYIKGEDVVVVNENKFVTILKGGINNARVKNARKR
jgi:SPP1 gp7 family putative phage head morphogenesis protein